MKKVSFFILILCCANFPGISQDAIAEKYNKLILAEELEDNLSILASDALEGRATGFRGQKMAATFIASYFDEVGLEPPVNGTFLQAVDFIQISINDVNIKSAENSFIVPKDLVYFGSFPPAQEITDELVFVGFGEKSDFDLVDVKDKSVLVLNKDTILNSWMSVLALAVEKEVSEIFYIPRNSDQACKGLWKYFSDYMKSGTMRLANSTEPNKWHSFFVKPSVAAKMMNTSIEKLILVAEDFNKKHKKVKPGSITYSFETDEKIVKADNVLGLVEGSDKRDELIVISSHYDHLEKKDGEGDVIYNGADDNGSGTVAVMNLAKAFAEAKKNGNGPRRSILFAAFTAEEMGLLGSECYTLNPIFPLDKTMANLNIDMIGRRDTIHGEERSFVYLIGSDMLSTELHNISETANATYTNLELDYTYNDTNHPAKFIEGSDQWNFMKNRIPVIFYCGGLHEDYHKPSDEVDKIDFDLLAQRTQLVFFTAWEIANRENPITLDKIDEVGH